MGDWGIEGNGISQRDVAARMSLRFLGLLAGRRSISVAEIARELEVSERTARRWVEAYSGYMDLRVEHGIVVIGG